MFSKEMIDFATLNVEQVHEFKQSAVEFEYRERLGTVKGWRDQQGCMLIEQVMVNDDLVEQE